MILTSSISIRDDLIRFPKMHRKTVVGLNPCGIRRSMRIPAGRLDAIPVGVGALVAHTSSPPRSVNVSLSSTSCVTPKREEKYKTIS